MISLDVSEFIYRKIDLLKGFGGSEAMGGKVCMGLTRFRALGVSETPSVKGVLLFRFFEFFENFEKYCPKLLFSA